MRGTFAWGIGLVAWSVSAPLYAQASDAHKIEMDRWELAEKQHLAQLIRIEFDQRRSEQPAAGPDKGLLLKYPKYSLQLLDTYSNDPSKRVRLACCQHAWSIGVARRPADAIRKEVVAQLVEKCFDPEGVVWQYAARRLLDFDEQDFTSDVLKTLGDNVIDKPIRDDVLLVVGVANLFVLDTWLKSIADDHFFAVLALARLGDDEAARRAVERVKQIENQTGRLYQAMARLAYTRHPTALEYLFGYLERDDGEITVKESGDFYRPPYGKAALDAIAKYWPDCPVQKLSMPGKYTPADLQAAREWVRNKLRERRP